MGCVGCGYVHWLPHAGLVRGPTAMDLGLPWVEPPALGALPA